MVNKNNDVRIQSACNVVAKYQIVPSYAVVEVDRPMYALS